MALRNLSFKRRLARTPLDWHRPSIEPLENRLLLTVARTVPWPGYEQDILAAHQAATIDIRGVSGAGKTGPLASIGYDLASVYEEFNLQQTKHPEVTFQPYNQYVSVAGNRVGVELVAAGDVNQLTAQLATLGMNVTATAGSLIDGTIPITALPQLSSVSGIVSASPAYRGITSSGSVADQGDQSMRSNLARSAYGVDGSGTTVGILSDSFNALTYPNGVSGLQQDIKTGDLPQNTSILQDFPFGEDEGRAMAQIVHDIAPGAAIQFATAFAGGQADFANNIRRLAAAGSNVIVDDAFLVAEPFFQNGVIAQAVNEVVGQGVSYFAAAGNHATNSYQANYVDSGVIGGGDLKERMHDFDPGPGVSTFQKIVAPVGVGTSQPVYISLQWDQPFRSLGGSGATSDVDLFVYGSDKTTIIYQSTNLNRGGDPLEIVAFSNFGNYDFDGDGIPDTTFYVSIGLHSGATPGLLKYIAFTNGQPLTIVDFATDSSTTVGHPNAEGAMAVAASAYYFTPAFGTSAPILNSFSSMGGTPLLFSPTGTRLSTPILTGSPQVTGVDSANTTFFGVDLDGDGLPNFPGTSAAAPHVAAVAALLVQVTGGRGNITPQQIYHALENTAIDIVARNSITSPGSTPIDIPNGAGIDAFSGYGLVDAMKAIQILSSGITIGDDVAKFEGDSGFTNFVFKVFFTGTATDQSTTTFTTVDGTATAGSDYVATSGTLTFLPGGPTTQLITVQVRGDVEVEPDETFFVKLTNIGSDFVRSQAKATILNDDVDIAIDDITVVEGDSGTSNAVFTVTTNGTSARNVSFSYATIDGTANGFTDYIPKSGTVLLPAYGSTARITVPIVGDKLNEATETFSVVLTNPIFSRIVKGTGIGTILDNDPQPALYINDVHVTTTQSGVLAAVFTVALDNQSGQTVTIDFATSDGSALAGVDYLPQSGTLTFAPGLKSQQIVVPVLTSAVYEANRKFYLNLSNPVHAVIGDPQGVGTIIFAPAAGGEYIIDDGDPGYSHSNGWTNATNTLSYQLDYEYHAPGNGSGTAAWTFASLPAGTYQVYARWSAFGNRATNAPYSVFDGSTQLGTVLVNQQLPPTGDQSEGITWQLLGTYTTSSGKLVVRLNDNANGYVTADAIRIVSGGIPAQSPEMDVAGYEHGINTNDITPSVDDATDFGTLAATSNSVNHTFQITNTGNADLHLTGDARVQITGDGASDFTVVTQPPLTIAPGVSSSFQIMFHPTQVGLRTATVVIPNDDDTEHPYTFQIQGTGADAGPSEFTIDDSTFGFSTSNNNWATNSNSTAFAGQVHTVAAGSGSNKAYWNFNGLAPGSYDVLVTWIPFGNRATNAPFTVSDGSGSQSTLLVNQQQAPVGTTADGVTWRLLTTQAVVNGSLSVMLTDQANGYVVADAVRLVRRDVLSAAPAAVAHNLAMPWDVNSDSRITSLDALLVINNLLSSSAVTAAPQAATDAAASSPKAASYFADVNDDGAVTPRDLLMVINYLIHPQIIVTPQVTADEPTAASQTTVVTASAAEPAAAVPASTATDTSAVILPLSAVDQAIGQLDAPASDGPAASGAASASANPASAAPASSLLLTPQNVNAYFATTGKSSTEEESDDDSLLTL